MGHTVNQSKRKPACNASRLPFVVEWHPYEAAATEQKNCAAAAFGRTHRRNPSRKTCEGSRGNVPFLAPDPPSVWRQPVRS